MEFSVKTIQKLMKISAVDLDKQMQEDFCHDLTKITKWIEKLNTMDTTKVSPLTTLSVECNKWTEDRPQQPLSVRKALCNAPIHDGAYFRVPTVEEKQE